MYVYKLVFAKIVIQIQCTYLTIHCFLCDKWSIYLKIIYVTNAIYKMDKFMQKLLI